MGQYCVYRDDIDDGLKRRMVKAGAIAWDIETTGLDWKSDRIATCQLAVDSDVLVVQISPGVTPRNLSDLLVDPAVQKVFHHAPFDLRFMSAHWGLLARNVACTKVASKILNPEMAGDEHSLQRLLRRHLNIEISKAERLSNWAAESLSQEQLRYATDDVRYLVDLVNVLRNKCDEAGLAHALQASYGYLPTRVHLDLNGSGDVFLY